MKYIILAVEKGGMIIEYPVIFPEALIHADVAKALQDNLLQLKYAIPVAAGDLPSASFAGGCSGRSATLNLESRTGDDEMIMMRDYNAGINYA